MIILIESSFAIAVYEYYGISVLSVYCQTLATAKILDVAHWLGHIKKTAKTCLKVLQIATVLTICLYDMLSVAFLSKR